jgi:predicted TIM-barrel fold metal-dependent hydrolase
MTGGSVALPLIVRRGCPDVCLVLDHCWSPLAWDDYLAFAHEYPDVWMTLHGLPQMLLRRVIRDLGPDRILLGSWYPENDPDLVLLQVERAWSLGGRLDETLTANAERAAAGRRPGPT